MPEEYRSGIKVIRQGGKYGVYTRARRYVKSHLSEFDIIVDEINTVPFRIPKIAKGKPVLAVIHQLAREVWFYETRFPIGLLGYFVLEPLWLRGYRRIPTVTVSYSTKEDLLGLGFQRVHVIHNGIGITPADCLAPKESKPVLAFLGRLVRCKLPDHAIKAFKEIKTILPEAELWVIGDGYLRPKLEKETVNGVRFFGRVTEQQKFDMLKKARVLLVPSVREGWGISVIEANAVGTPAVGYDAPGLRDSIVHGFNGFLVPFLNVGAMARAAEKIICDPSLAEKFSRNALDWSKRFSWDEAAKRFHDVLESVVRGS
jgi:glycosyltransferase involved in cell wall biosynthesis